MEKIHTLPQPCDPFIQAASASLGATPWKEPPVSASGVQGSNSEPETIWEDLLDSLGSEPSLDDLDRLLRIAPNKDHSTYHFASGVVIARWSAGRLC